MRNKGFFISLLAFSLMLASPVFAQEENGFKKFNVMYVICSILHDEEWVRSDGKHHGDIDIAIAVEHLCLAATEQGLATCWVCNFDAEKCKQLFAIADNEEPAVLIPIGYPADELKEKKRKAVEEIVK